MPNSPSSKQKEIGKVCTTCGVFKPFKDMMLARVYKGKKYYGPCKLCDYERNKRYKKRVGFYHSETFRNFVKRKGYNTYKHRKARLERYNEKYPEKISARQAVNDALKKGNLVKTPCHCGEIKVEGHHFKGYKKENWLDVVWLCMTHHKKIHNEKS